MAGLAVVQSGSTTMVVGTPVTLESPSITAANIYQLLIETQNLASGDILLIQIKTKGQSGILQVTLSYAYANAQAELNKLSVPVPSTAQISFVLTQTAGTARVIPWQILSLQ